MLDWTEIILRLGVATLAGGLIGLNRDLHGKPIGLKTLALVSACDRHAAGDGRIPTTPESSRTPGSRVMQGILTGIGFLGAGVIVHAGPPFQGSRAHQRRLHLAGGLHRNRLRSRTMARRGRPHCHHLRGLVTVGGRTRTLAAQDRLGGKHEETRCTNRKHRQPDGLRQITRPIVVRRPGPHQPGR